MKLLHTSLNIFLKKYGIGILLKSHVLNYEDVAFSIVISIYCDYEI